MHTEVKKYAENNDIKSLRYIFVDCLDVDPTFDKYREDYEYCRNISGLFEAYTELTPFISDKGQWDKQYWEKVKLDLMKNFSTKRFEHMIDVAKVVYADKISRLISERHIEENQHKEKTSVEFKKTEQINQSQMRVETKKPNILTPYEEARKIEESKRKLALENQKVEEEQRKQRERIEARKAELARQNSAIRSSESKKVMGIVLVIVAVVVVILLIRVL